MKKSLAGLNLLEAFFSWAFLILSYTLINFDQYKVLFFSLLATEIVLFIVISFLARAIVSKLVTKKEADSNSIRISRLKCFIWVIFDVILIIALGLSLISLPIFALALIILIVYNYLKLKYKEKQVYRYNPMLVLYITGNKKIYINKDYQIYLVDDSSK